MRCVIQCRGPRYWHADSKVWGRNIHSASVYATKTEAEVEREASRLSPHTTHLVPAPQRYVQGTVEGFARRGLRRVT